MPAAHTSHEWRGTATAEPSARIGMGPSTQPQAGASPSQEWRGTAHPTTASSKPQPGVAGNSTHTVLSQDWPGTTASHRTLRLNWRGTTHSRKDGSMPQPRVAANSNRRARPATKRGVHEKTVPEHMPQAQARICVVQRTPISKQPPQNTGSTKKPYLNTRPIPKHISHKPPSKSRAKSKPVPKHGPQTTTRKGKIKAKRVRKRTSWRPQPGVTRRGQKQKPKHACHRL